jgi:A/G-specific adenine glycosylase
LLKTSGTFRGGRATGLTKSEEELLKYWEGLGYYSRLRNIHRTAKILVSDHAGRFPREYRTILSLPGIGIYTAGAIMSLAFNDDRPVVDGNVERFFARLFNIGISIRTKEGRESVWRMAKSLIPEAKARYFNQAVMEMGALVCLPRNPTCPTCPVKDDCQSLRSGVVDQRPVPGKRKAVKPIEAAVGVLVDRGRILIQKRPGTGLMPHLWEFPGGKLKGNGEIPEEALIREFREELELDICRLDKITVLKHSYTSFRVVLHAFYCALSRMGQ